MVESYEKRSGNIVNEIYLKLGIDSHVHYDRGGKVCEILFGFTRRQWIVVLCNPWKMGWKRRI